MTRRSARPPYALDRLVVQLAEQGRTRLEIVRELGLHTQAYHRIVKRTGVAVALDRPRLPPGVSEAAAQAYAEGKTWDQIAELVGVHHRSVGYLVRKGGGMLNRKGADQ